MDAAQSEATMVANDLMASNRAVYPFESSQLIFEVFFCTARIPVAFENKGSWRVPTRTLTVSTVRLVRQLAKLVSIIALFFQKTRHDNEYLPRPVDNKIQAPQPDEQ